MSEPSAIDRARRNQPSNNIAAIPKRKSVKKELNNTRRWTQAIEDAKDTISKCQRKIESLYAAIKVFERSREEGEPFPGTTQSKHQSEEQQHSV